MLPFFHVDIVRVPIVILCPAVALWLPEAPGDNLNFSLNRRRERRVGAVSGEWRGLQGSTPSALRRVAFKRLSPVFHPYSGRINTASPA